MDLFERLLIEAAQLQERVSKLRSFIKSERFISVSENQRKLLSDQLRLMESYQGVLFLRIEDLKEGQSEN